MITVAELVAQKKIIDEQVENIKDCLTDKSIPLEVRWDNYEALCSNHLLVKNEIYGDGEIDILGDNFTMYDDFNTDRGQILEYVDMYETINEKIEEGVDGWEEVTKEDINRWREKILARGYSSFTYDW